eukprot:Hpha_TRINITY_DN39_c0_g1::TRINITY_DN39_c0_g1_i1::g.110011::m.110011
MFELSLRGSSDASCLTHRSSADKDKEWTGEAGLLFDRLDEDGEGALGGELLQLAMEEHRDDLRPASLRARDWNSFAVQLGILEEVSRGQFRRLWVPLRTSAYENALARRTAFRRIRAASRGSLLRRCWLRLVSPPEPAARATAPVPCPTPPARTSSEEGEDHHSGPLLSPSHSARGSDRTERRQSATGSVASPAAVSRISLRSPAPVGIPTGSAAAADDDGIETARTVRDSTQVMSVPASPVVPDISAAGGEHDEARVPLHEKGVLVLRSVPGVRGSLRVALEDAETGEERNVGVTDFVTWDAASGEMRCNGYTGVVADECLPGAVTRATTLAERTGVRWIFPALSGSPEYEYRPSSRRTSDPGHQTPDRRLASAHVTPNCRTRSPAGPRSAGSGVSPWRPASSGGRGPGIPPTPVSLPGTKKKPPPGYSPDALAILRVESRKDAVQVGFTDAMSKTEVRLCADGEELRLYEVPEGGEDSEFVATVRCLTWVPAAGKLETEPRDLHPFPEHLGWVLGGLRELVRRTGVETNIGDQLMVPAHMHAASRRATSHGKGCPSSVPVDRQTPELLRRVRVCGGKELPRPLARDLVTRAQLDWTPKRAHRIARAGTCAGDPCIVGRLEAEPVGRGVVTVRFDDGSVELWPISCLHFVGAGGVRGGGRITVSSPSPVRRQRGAPVCPESGEHSPRRSHDWRTFNRWRHSLRPEGGPNGDAQRRSNSQPLPKHRDRDADDVGLREKERAKFKEKFGDLASPHRQFSPKPLRTPRPFSFRPNTCYHPSLNPHGSMFRPKTAISPRSQSVHLPSPRGTVERLYPKLGPRERKTERSPSRPSWCSRGAPDRSSWEQAQARKEREAAQLPPRSPQVTKQQVKEITTRLCPPPVERPLPAEHQEVTPPRATWVSHTKCETDVSPPHAVTPPTFRPQLAYHPKYNPEGELGRPY